MGIEIERKFLVKRNREQQDLLRSWEKNVDIKRERIKQAYLRREKPSVRIRLIEEIDPNYVNRCGPGIDFSGFITIKGKATGISRTEYEVEIDPKMAKDLFAMYEENQTEGFIIQKTRYHYDRWEIDVFEKENLGLIIAEIELTSEDEEIEIPDWVGTEVSEDPRFGNADLSRYPFANWPVEERTRIYVR